MVAPLEVASKSQPSQGCVISNFTTWPKTSRFPKASTATYKPFLSKQMVVAAGIAPTRSTNQVDGLLLSYATVNGTRVR